MIGDHNFWDRNSHQMHRIGSSGIWEIFVADIFGGPRETSGSSFALIKALDWLAAQGVPVINISLVGPQKAGAQRY